MGRGEGRREGEEAGRVGERGGREAERARTDFECRGETVILIAAK